MYFLITIILLVALFVSKDLQFLIGAGLFAIADTVDSLCYYKNKNRKDS